MAKQSKRLKAGHWYVVGWTDAPPQAALCVSTSRAVMDAEFWFPSWPRSRPIDNIDGPMQVLQHLGVVKVPTVPAKLRGFRLPE